MQIQSDNCAFQVNEHLLRISQTIKRKIILDAAKKFQETITMKKLLEILDEKYFSMTKKLPAEEIQQYILNQRAYLKEEFSKLS